jgi:ribosomal subunit interface protein
MSFPTITFKHTNIEPDYQLQSLVQGKLSVLEKYLHGAHDVRCEVEFERLTGHQQGPVCRIEVNIWRGSQLSRAETVEESFEKATDEVRRTLEHDLERSHDKRVSVFRKGARRIKEMMRGW